ncbi:hypothetical protein P7C73_g818, partial [Tremellales sp. Uapishka_1]
MPARPPLDSIAISSSSSQIRRPPTKIHALYPLFAQLTFHVVPAKIGEDLGQLYETIEELGGKCVGADQAMIVVTALQGRPRIVRAVGQFIVDTIPILNVAYISDTFDICLATANSRSDEPPHLPPRENYLVGMGIGAKRPRASFEDDEDDDEETLCYPRKRRRRETQDPGVIDDGLPDMEIYPEDVKFREIDKLCILRGSPLICVNQELINAIKPIFEYREFEAGEQKNTNILSYRRSMSVIKAVPRMIKSGKEALLLTDLGDKVAQRIDEFLREGRIQESEDILASSKYKSLREFDSVFTVGKHTAMELYEVHNCRDLEDVRAHYANLAEESEEMRMKEKLRRRREGGMTKVDIVEEWLKIGHELAAKIPREEVQEIADCVMEHLEALQPDCEYTLTGGYRRGKTASNDVDIVFRPPKDGQDVGLLRNLYIRMSRCGIITHVLQITGRVVGAPIHASANNFDNLDKAFVIFKLPGKGRLHRRVDLISAPRDRYAAAVLSWSGSMMFERDLRRFAEDHGYKFRAGLVKITTGEEINFETEREIFHFLGLRYVPPTLRNADG